jgi:glycosyltransferase involved in cell wall biosynthesis
MSARAIPRAALVRTRQAVRPLARRARAEADWLASRRGRADLAVFHEFLPPPTGGGSQFLRALVGELRRRGLAVEVNRLSGGTGACLFNSFNFDFARLRRFARPGCRMVHRVDGPIGTYRGFDDGTDARIATVNRELADATIFQSRFSLAKHRELGLDLQAPVVVPNAVDPAIFFPPSHRPPLEGRRVRLIAASWSDNPNKGSEILRWLDRNLDRTRYELTFAGRAPVRFEHVKAVGPFPSDRLAALLRDHDVYLAPSRDDPCSNALLEALACGLPAAYLASGGHPELAGEGGLPFSQPEELPGVLERLAAELEARRAAIAVPPLQAVADRYLDVLGLGRT